MKVDPRYLTTPIRQLVAEKGWDWIRVQQKLFEQILMESCDVKIN